jgi:hypothetical protein
MASSHRKIIGFLDEDNQSPELVATEEQIPKAVRLVNNLLDRYEMTEEDYLIFTAKYFNNPDSPELQSLLTDEPVASTSHLESYDYYQNSMEQTFFPEPVVSSEADVEPAAYVVLASTAPTIKR